MDSLTRDDIKAALRKHLLQLLITLDGLVVALALILFTAAIDDGKYHDFCVLRAQRETAIGFASAIVDIRSVLRLLEADVDAILFLRM